MSALDTYQNLKRLVSFHKKENLPLIKENRESLFEDLSAYFYFHQNREASLRRTNREIKFDDSQKIPLTSSLCEEGHLIFTIHPKRLLNLSLKEIRFVILLNLESYRPYELSKQIGSDGKGSGSNDSVDHRIDMLYKLANEIASLFEKQPHRRNDALNYKEVSDKKGDLFDKAADSISGSEIPNKIAAARLLSFVPFGNVQDEDGNVDKDAIYKFARRICQKLLPGSRGLLPWGGLAKLAKPVKIIPKWVKILSRFSSGRTREVRKTKTRLNRLQPQRFDLSGEIKERRPEVVCAIDTSGSRYADRIKKALGQVLALKVKFNYSITLIECDAKIQKITEIKKKSDIPDRYHGRGGTSYLPVIDYINSHPRYRNALLIYFTDGYGDGEIPKPKVRQTVWVLTEGDYLSLKNPYGDVVLIDGEKTIKRSR